VNRVVVGHLLTRLQHRIEAVFDHLHLVAMHRCDDLEPTVGHIDDP
jgi:hypothetical protein